MKISVLVAAMNEANHIPVGLKSLLVNVDPSAQLLFSIPDEPTWQAALNTANQLGFKNVTRSELTFDGKPKGKPAELNALMELATGDVWIFCDPGDTTFDNNAINLLTKKLVDEQADAVTGRPVSADGKNNFMAYMGSMLADAAHHKRSIDLAGAAGRGARFVTKLPFFPVSGYLFAMKPTDIRVPSDCLVEDAYISYVLYEQGKKIAYEPNALVYVKYANNLKDYFKQKKRSVGGYVQIWKYGIVTKVTNTRSFARELEYFWYPITYAKSLTQLAWSLYIYPLRLWLWLMIFWERRILKKDFTRTWVRIESTKQGE